MTNVDQKGPNFSYNMYLKNRQGRYGTANFVFSLTDEQGLMVGTTKSVRMRPDPIIFDLNEDGKVETTGAPTIEKGIYLAPGLWDVSVGSLPTDYRFVIADTNNATRFTTNTSLNASGRWGLSIEKRNAAGDWEAIDTKPSFKDTTGTITAGDVKLNLVQTSDGGYKMMAKALFLSVGGRVRHESATVLLV